MAVFDTPRPRRSRLVVTGAAGTIGTFLRGRLGHLAEEVVRSDLAEVETAEGEVSRPCDLTDLTAVRELLHGGGDVIHLGGQSVEAPFAAIRDANLVGTYHLYEAARLEGVRRVLFASSNHAVGFHERTTRLDADAPVRPDTLYGVSKVFGEAVARLYWDKFGVESLILRIGSVLAEPGDLRHLATWLSVGDLVRLIERMVLAPRLGCAIVYGASASPESWWDNRQAAYLGWEPRDSSEPFRAALEARERPDPGAVETVHQGGVYTGFSHPDD